MRRSALFRSVRARSPRLLGPERPGVSRAGAGVADVEQTLRRSRVVSLRHMRLAAGCTYLSPSVHNQVDGVGKCGMRDGGLRPKGGAELGTERGILLISALYVEWY